MYSILALQKKISYVCDILYNCNKQCFISIQSINSFKRRFLSKIHVVNSFFAAVDSFHYDSDLSLLTKDKAAARLDILRQHKGIGVITEEPGSGKSFCLSRFAHSLSKSLYKVIYIPITTLTVMEFYMALCDGLGITPAYKKVTMFKQIQNSIYGSVLVLFGKTAFGYFACIPDFEAGCHLSHLKNTF